VCCWQDAIAWPDWLYLEIRRSPLVARQSMVCNSWIATCIRKPFPAMALSWSARSHYRSHVLHGPPESPESQHIAPNRSTTDLHLSGICSQQMLEQNGVLFGLSPAATGDWHPTSKSGRATCGSAGAERRQPGGWRGRPLSDGGGRPVVGRGGAYRRPAVDRQRGKDGGVTPQASPVGAARAGRAAPSVRAKP